MSVEGIKPCALANTGLLVASLQSRLVGSRKPTATDEKVAERDQQEGRESKCVEQDERAETWKSLGEAQEVAAVNFVVQVSDVGNGRLMRCIYSPLE